MKAQQVKDLFLEIGYPIDMKFSGDKTLEEFLSLKEVKAGDYWDGNYHQGIECAYHTIVEDNEGPYDCYTIRWVDVEYLGNDDFVVVAWDDRYWGGDWIGGTSIGSVESVEDYKRLCCPETADDVNETQGCCSSQYHKQGE
jgi:hypothetical protein